jgi:polyhydroxyalkanoate synthesis regulator phasin
MGKEDLINKYYDLVNNLNITDNLTPLEIGSLTVPKIRDAVNQLVEKQKTKNKNDEQIEKLNTKLVIQENKLKDVISSNISETKKKTKADQHTKNINDLKQQITELLK